MLFYDTKHRNDQKMFRRIYRSYGTITQYVDALLITKYFKPGAIEINDTRRCHLLTLDALTARSQY